MKNKESFTGTPTGYTNLLVSDPDGNLDTFSIETLSGDIQTMIDKSLEPYSKTQDIEDNYYSKSYINNNYYNKTTMNGSYYNKNDMSGLYYSKNAIDSFNFIKQGQPIGINALTGGEARLIVGTKPGNHVIRSHNMSDYGPPGEGWARFNIEILN